MNNSSPFTSPAYDLLPADIVGNIPALAATSEDPDPMLHIKIFTPDSGFTWYIAYAASATASSLVRFRMGNFLVR